MSFTTKSPRSGSCITTAWLIGLGCLLDGLRVFMLTRSAIGSTSGSTTGSAIILAFALALDLVFMFRSYNLRGRCPIS